MSDEILLNYGKKYAPKAQEAISLLNTIYYGVGFDPYFWYTRKETRMEKYMARIYRFCVRYRLGNLGFRMWLLGLYIRCDGGGKA